MILEIAVDILEWMHHKKTIIEDIQVLFRFVQVMYQDARQQCMPCYRPMNSLKQKLVNASNVFNSQT